MKGNRKPQLILAILLGISLLVTACGSGNGNQKTKTVRVAVSFPLNLAIGQDMLNGAQLALDEAGGKAGSVKVELFVIDAYANPEVDPFSSDLETNAAHEAAKEKNVVAYLGPYTSGQTSVSLPILNEAGIAQLGIATWPGLTKPGFAVGAPGIFYPSGQRTFFRVIGTDDVQIDAAVRWVGRMGFTNVYLFDDGSRYGSGVAGLFEAVAQDENIKIAGHTLFDPLTETNYAGLAEQALAANPDLVFIGGYASQGGDQLVAALRAQSPNFPIMGADALLDDVLITRDGAAAEQVWATNVFAPAEALNNADAANMITSYMQTYGTTAVPLYAVNSYEAMKVALYAIEKADKPTREGVLNALNTLQSYSGVLGTWSFDTNGDMRPAIVTAWQVQDGAWKFIEIIE